MIHRRTALAQRDPIEVEGISRVFHHKTGRPTLISAIKPSLGHSEGASGITSIIKVVLALEQHTVPATTGVNNINPSIKTDERYVEIAVAHCQWPQSLAPRASVNSFGFGGANSHAILEAPDAHNSCVKWPCCASGRPFCFYSGRC